MEESNEIKNAISKRSIFDPIGTAPLPPLIEEIERKALEKPDTAPLFIKIDKYKDVLQGLHDLKVSVSNISEVLRVRSDLEEMRSRTNEILEKSFNQFVDLANKLDNQFAVPKVMKPFVKTENIERIDGFVSEIQNEIDNLKKSLDSL